MSQLRPVPKICQVKSQSLDYLPNKVLMNLRGWVAVAENPHWFALPTAQPQKNEQCSPAASKQQECKFLEVSRKKGGGAFLQGGVFIW